jgi:hypothetical protein
LDHVALQKTYTKGSFGYKLRTQVKKGSCNQDLSTKKLKDCFQHNEAGVAELMQFECIKISQSLNCSCCWQRRWQILRRMGAHTSIRAIPQPRHCSALLQPLVKFGHDLYLPVRLISIQTATFIWTAVDCGKFRLPKRSQLI